MKINFAVPLLDLEKESLKDPKGNPLLFSKQIGNLIFQLQEKENHLANYELAKKIYHCTEETEFSQSEVEKIKEKVKESWSAGFYGQVHDLIKAAEADPKPIGGGGGGSAKPPKSE